MMLLALLICELASCIFYLLQAPLYIDLVLLILCVCYCNMSWTLCVSTGTYDSPKCLLSLFFLWFSEVEIEDVTISSPKVRYLSKEEFVIDL